MKKFLSMFAALAVFFGLAACGNTEANVVEEPETEEVVEEEPAEEVDVVSHATSGGGSTAEEMIEILGATSENRAWVFGLRDDIELDGELNIEGEVLKHSGGAWTDGIYERKVGMYRRDEVDGVARIPVGTFTLTVTEGINVYSNNTFFISDGPFVADVYADVFVNAPGFNLRGVTIHGDLVFASQEYMDSAFALAWDSETAEIQEGDGGDIVLYRSNSGWVDADLADFVTGTISVDGVDAITHATSGGGATAEEMIEVLGAESANRAWVFGLRDDIELDGELNIEGEVLKHSGGAWTDGIYERKVGMYRRDEVAGVNRIPVGTFTLTVTEGINVYSNNTFFISDGPFVADVFADVFVNAPGFNLRGVTIHGNLVFASQEYMDSAFALAWDSETAEIQEGDGGDIVLYRSNSGWVDADLADFVTGSITVAE